MVGTPASEVIRRKASRAVLLTEDLRVLLMRVQNPSSGFQVWITPGGGIEPGESEQAGLRRELEEETGAKEIQIGPPVWTRVHEFSWDGQFYHQTETYFLVEIDRFDPVMDREVAPAETSAFREFRWWSIDEIERSEETFAPRNIGELVREMAKYGPPAEPIAVGI